MVKSSVYRARKYTSYNHVLSSSPIMPDRASYAPHRWSGKKGVCVYARDSERKKKEKESQRKYLKGN